MKNAKTEKKVSYEVSDIGYGYLKIPDPNNPEKVIKIKAVVALLGESLNSDGDSKIDVIEVDGVAYVVGDDVYKLGKNPITSHENLNRAQNIAYKVLALYGLAKYGRIDIDGKVGFLTGLPFQNLDEADTVKEVLQKEHTVIFNGKELKIALENVIVTSQGLGTFYSLAAQRGEKIFSKKILIGDLGFGTINWVPLNNGNIDKEFVKTNRDLGIQNAYKKIADAVNLEFKANYKFYDVDDLLDKGVPSQDIERGKFMIPILDRPYVVNAFTAYAQRVWADFEDKYDSKYREELDEVVFAGGTADRVQKYLLDVRKQYCSVMDNPQDAQVLGYQYISDRIPSNTAE